MRKQFVTTLEKILAEDDQAVLLLGDIGVFGFRQAFAAWPERIYNIGILEQSTIGLAAGLAMTGFIPTVHTIATFLVERAFEQLKLDFCYQGLGGNFVSVGGAYDYAALGCTHHCPGDVGILKTLPTMEIVLPGTPAEFDILFKSAYNDGQPTYYRLSERSNSQSFAVEFGKGLLVKKGKSATILAVGTALNPVLEAVRDLDVSVLYYTTVRPFDYQLLKETAVNNKIMLCEPYYSGGLLPEIRQAFGLAPLIIETIGVPNVFLHHYGQPEEHDQFVGLTAANIRQKLLQLINC